MWDPRYSTGAYPTREAFMHACIPILRREIRELMAIGVDAIQLDDPWLGATGGPPDYRERENIADLEQENLPLASSVSTRRSAASRAPSSASISATPISSTAPTPPAGPTTSSWTPWGR